MEDTSGFYKYENGNNLLYAPNGVMHCNYDLLKTNILEKLTAKLRKNKNFDPDDIVLNRIANKLPLHDSWYWFDSEADAKAFFGIVDKPQTPQT